MPNHTAVIALSLAFGARHRLPNRIRNRELSLSARHLTPTEGETIMSAPSIRRPGRRLRSTFSLWLAVMFLGLVQRAAAVRADGDRGEQNTVSVVVWAVAALALALIATAIISGWAGNQLSVFGG